METKESLKLLHSISGHNGAIYDVVFNDGFLYTTSADKFVAKWDVSKGEQTNFTVQLERSAYNLDFSPVSNLLAIGTNNGGIHVIDTVKREEVRWLAQHKAAVFALTYCQHTERFYSGDKDGVFCAWDAKTFDLLITLPFNCGKIREISTSEDGLHIAICGQDGYIRILETGFFNLIKEFKAHKEGANCALFDGDVLYTGGKDAHIKKWNWKEKELLLSIPAHNYAVYDLIFIDGKQKMVSVSFDKSIKLWNAMDISIIERVEFKNKGHRHTVNRIAKISEQSFATIGDDRKIKIWSL
ncbi:WD40 repeat domain-containing protein [Brumimicrobium sp.]|uniref:WD40 repeat domain-containing protein n=1 Tax=Brumimicrobium sp. TaxID=2029867 RepID=UPI003A8E9181